VFPRGFSVGVGRARVGSSWRSRRGRRQGGASFAELVAEMFPPEIDDRTAAELLLSAPENVQRANPEAVTYAKMLLDPDPSEATKQTYVDDMLEHGRRSLPAKEVARLEAQSEEASERELAKELRRMKRNGELEAFCRGSRMTTARWLSE
jgi:hypothetical protein